MNDKVVFERILLSLSLTPTKLTTQLAKICGLTNSEVAYQLVRMRDQGVVAGEKFKGDDYFTWKLTEKGKRMAVGGDREGDDKSIYYVFRVGGHSPVVEHRTYDDAEKEAARLSMKHLGYKYRVLKVVADVEVSIPKPEVVKY